MKKILAIALVLMLALGLAPVYAAGGEVQLYSTMTEADLDALIT